MVTMSWVAFWLTVGLIALFMFYAGWWLGKDARDELMEQNARQVQIIRTMSGTISDLRTEVRTMKAKQAKVRRGW